MDSKSRDWKGEFIMKKKLFENAPQTMDTLLEERRDLYHRLQLSREELDSYIRYMHRMCDEKGQLSDELSTLKTTNETLAHKCKRLENQNKLLVKESNDLMKMLADFGPKELYNYSRTNPNTEEAIIKKLKESLQVIFDENGKLHQEQDLLKQELRSVTSELNESQKKVNELTKEIDIISGDRDKEKHLQARYEQLLIEHAKCVNAEGNKKHRGVSIRNSSAATDGNEQFYSIESSTPPSLPIFQGDSSSILNSTCKNSFNVDIFDDFPYKLRSYDVYSDSEPPNSEGSSLYKSALPKSSRNNSSSMYESCQGDTGQEITATSINTSATSNNQPKASSPYHSRNPSDADKNKLKVLKKTSTIDSNIDVFGLIVTIREIHQTVRSLFKLLEATEQQDQDDEHPADHLLQNNHPSKLPMPNVEELLNTNEVTSHTKAFENLSCSIDEIKNEVLDLSRLLARMNSEFTDVREENEMLAKEITALKYALTCRIELKNSRTTPSTPIEKCNCDQKTMELNNKCAKFEETIVELNTKIEELTEERSNLFSLITQIANSSDSGNE